MKGLSDEAKKAGRKTTKLSWSLLPEEYATHPFSLIDPFSATPEGEQKESALGMLPLHSSDWQLSNVETEEEKEKAERSTWETIVSVSIVLYKNLLKTLDAVIAWLNVYGLREYDVTSTF